MYEAFFELLSNPFGGARTGDFVYEGRSLKLAKTQIVQAVDRAEGVAVLMGGSGVGKSTLGRVICSHFRQHLELCALECGNLNSPRVLLQAILFELGLPHHERDPGILALTLHEHLRRPRTNRQSRGLLLLLDEAQTIPVKVLEQARLLTNQPRASLHLVLIGSSALEERLASPRLESLQQRIAVRAYLESLSELETAEFVQTLFGRAGGAADVFSGEAVRAIHRASEGIPRLICQLCDHALLLACQRRIRQVKGSLVEEAWADLQQLPVAKARPPIPMGAASVAAHPASSGDGVLEFGQLADDDDPPTSKQAPSRAAVEPGRTLDQNRASAPPVRAQTPTAAVFKPAAASVQNTASTVPNSQPRQPATTLPTVANSNVRGTAAATPHRAQHDRAQLVARPAVNPFEEGFEEEEVIVDHFGIWSPAIFGNSPMVRCAESQHLSCLLEAAARIVAPLVSKTPASPAGPSNPPRSASAPVNAAPIVAAPTAAAQQVALPLAAPSAQAHNHQSLPGCLDTVVYDTNAAGPAVDWVVTGITAGAPPASIVPNQAEDANRTDQVRIVVEDDPIQTLARPLRPSSAVPKKEFTRLFTRLRQG